MNSFNTALNAVFPLFAYLALGIFLRRIKLTDEHTLQKMNKVTLKVFLACNIYYNVITADLKELFNARVLLIAMGIQTFILALSLVIAYLSEKTRKRRGALSHCIFHTNFVIFSTLLGNALCGEGNLGSIALMVATLVPYQNILSVIVLELHRENSHVTFKKVFGGVLSNPFVVAAILGFGTHLLHIQFPTLVTNIIRDLGRCGTPVALIVMGGLFNFGSIRSNLRSLIAGVFARLILVPALLLPVLTRTGFQGPDFVGILCVLIAPCANSCFSLACGMDSDADLTSQMVVFTSLTSLLTIFGWIFLLSSMGYV